jgi:lysophospholipase L1-like esterase
VSTRTKNIVVIWGGTNDLAGGATAAATFANLQTYVNARLAVGWSVVIVTCIDRGDVNINVPRAAYNALIAGAYSGGAVPRVVIADAAANANIGANGASSNATFFRADKVHLQPAGYAIVAPLVATAVQSL